MRHWGPFYPASSLFPRVSIFLCAYQTFTNKPPYSIRTSFLESSFLFSLNLVLGFVSHVEGYLIIHLGYLQLPKRFLTLYKALKGGKNYFSVKITNYEVNLLKFHSVVTHFLVDFYLPSQWPPEEITHTALNDTVTQFSGVLLPVWSL